MYLLAYQYRSKDYNLREHLISEIENSKDGNIPAGEYIVAEYNKNKFAKRYCIRIDYEPKRSITSLYHTGDTVHLKNFIPENNFTKNLTNDKLVSNNIWYLPQYECYVIKWPNGANGIEAIYEITGISAIKRRLFKEPLSIPYILKKDQLDDAVECNGEEYLFYYISLNGKVLNIRLI